MKLTHDEIAALRTAYRACAINRYTRAAVSHNPHDAISIMHTADVQMTENGAHVEAVVWVPVRDALQLAIATLRTDAVYCDVERARVKRVLADRFEQLLASL